MLDHFNSNMQGQSTSFVGNIIELSDNVKSQQGREINSDISMVQEMVHYEGIDMFDGANVNNESLSQFPILEILKGHMKL